MKRKRILFLISDTGGGHRAAANAIAEAIEHRYPGRYAVIISDIWKTHMRWPFYKLPGTYGWLSGAGKPVWLALWKVTALACLRKFFFEMIFPLVKNPMVRYLAALQPDLVVSLHPVMNHLGIKWVKAAALDVPLVTVVTDMVSLHPFWICPEVDRLIVPTQAARQQALRYGMPAAKLAVYGQPISLKFMQLKGNRRQCRRRLGLAAGALAGAGRLDPWGVFFAAGAGNLSADGIWYLIGYAGRLDAVRKRLPGFTRFDVQIRAVEKRLQKDGIKLLVVSKLSFGIAAIPILISAGMAKVSWRRILAAAGSCQVLLGGAMVVAGYFMGKSALRYRLGLEAALFFGGLLLLTLAMLVYRCLAAPGGNRNQREQADKS